MSLVVTAGAASGEFLVRDGDSVTRVFAVVSGGSTWVFHDGAVFVIAHDDDGPVRTAHLHGSLAAPMPATVIEVKVVPGAEVAQGDVLIVLEAMKMELPVRAPGDGTVKAVHCRAGELVQPGVPLIDFE